MENGLLARNQKEFLDMRLGMFIHFGLYSQGMDNEWHMWLRKMSLKQYKAAFFHTFDPDPAGPEQWVKRAKEMGAKYLVCTSKHCDGFCLWNTRFPHGLDPDYHIQNTPFFQKHKKGVLDYLIEAGRKHGIKIGFYHSVVDWSWSEKRWWKAPYHWIHDDARNTEYLTNLKSRLVELGELYPDLFYYWLDAYPMVPKGFQRLDYPGIYSLLHSKRPEVLVATNTGSTKFREDQLSVPEDVLIMENMAGRGEFIPIPAERPVNLRGIPAEVCITINNHWGYNDRDKAYKDIKKMAEYIKGNSKNGGNTLLNFGPKPDGFIADDQVGMAQELGRLLG